MSESITFAVKNMDYEGLNGEIKRTMRRSARDVVQLGFMLRLMMEDKIWEAAYGCFDEYLDKELHMDYSMASRLIGINKKYSINGHSMEIAEKYEGFSQGLLIEMLNMAPELEAKVTPDMTVKQVREIKKQERQKKEEAPAPEKEEAIIDGEYREVKEPGPADEKIATSQPENAGNSHDESCFVSHIPKKCITGWSRYGACNCCGNEGVQCCNQCNESCNSRCGWIDEPYNPEDEYKEVSEQIPESGLMVTKRILEQEKKLLNDYLEAGGLPEMTVLRQKTIVGALAVMVCDLEDEEQETEMPEEQPELPILKNNDQRKEWLNNYKAWGLWYRDEKIDINYYKYDFSDGSRLVVTEYPQRQSYWNKNKIEDEHFYHLLQINKEGYKFRYNEKFRNSIDSETYIIDFLKNLQKRGQ